VVCWRAACACLCTYVSQHPEVTALAARAAPHLTLVRHRMIVSEPMGIGGLVPVGC
jgi:hypothetical protein